MRKRISCETHYCQCKCGRIFECKENSKQRFISGHNMNTVEGRLRLSKLYTGRTKEEYGYIRRISEKKKGKQYVPREIRTCQCGCNETFECKVSSDKKFVIGHNVRVRNVGVERTRGQIRVPREIRICKCGCGQTFESKVSDKKKYILGHYMNVLENRNKQSMDMVKAYMEDRFNYRGGHFFSKKNDKNLHYRSPEELIAYQMLECNIKVVKYEVEVIHIPYFWNGGVHRYVVDLLVYYDDGSRQLIEIKMKYKLKDERTRLKIEAGKRYASDNGMGFQVWMEDKLYR